VTMAVIAGGGGQTGPVSTIATRCSTSDPRWAEVVPITLEAPRPASLTPCGRPLRGARTTVPRGSGQPSVAAGSIEPTGLPRPSRAARATRLGATTAWRPAAVPGSAGPSTSVAAIWTETRERSSGRIRPVPTSSTRPDRLIHRGGAGINTNAPSAGGLGGGSRLTFGCRRRLTTSGSRRLRIGVQAATSTTAWRPATTDSRGSGEGRTVIPERRGGGSSVRRTAPEPVRPWHRERAGRTSRRCWRRRKGRPGDVLIGPDGQLIRARCRTRLAGRCTDRWARGGAADGGRSRKAAPMAASSPRSPTRTARCGRGPVTSSSTPAAPARLARQGRGRRGSGRRRSPHSAASSVRWSSCSRGAGRQRTRLRAAGARSEPARRALRQAACAAEVAAWPAPRRTACDAGCAARRAPWAAVRRWPRQ
jgi:hypothetical protein